MKKPVYPFVAIVGQDDLKLSLILNVVHPALGGVLILGEKGTAKSTAVRGLGRLLGEIEVYEHDPFNTAPGQPIPSQVAKTPGANLPRLVRRAVPLVDLPISATEDRVVGTLDLERALKSGESRIQPGLLASAHRGILYVDEVNLLDDHVVDLLLDVAAMGVNTVEREGISFAHPSRFTLVGTMNPEEGELRPQLLDRFALCVRVEGLRDPKERVEVIRRRLAHEADPEAFAATFAKEEQELSERIASAKARVAEVSWSDAILLKIAQTSLSAGVDGHRADLVMLQGARALAAWEGRTEVAEEDVERISKLALPHRMRRQPFAEMGT
jgi:magnesium chelatase subunit I